MISPLAAGQVDGYPYTESSGFQAVIFVSLLETARTPEIPEMVGLHRNPA